MNTSRKARKLVRWPLAVMALSLMASAGCSDSDKDEPGTSERSNVLNLTPGQIAQFALADAPNPEFIAARNRVEGRVPTSRAQYARNYNLGTGRTPTSSDPGFASLRVDAATALGTSIDNNKANDAASANPALDLLLAEIGRYNAAATSCEGLPPPKNDNCAYALIIIEVVRSEAKVVDAGTITPVPDGGTPDSATPDSGTVSPVALFNCGNRDVTGALEVTANIDKDVTWSGKVLVKGSRYTTAGTLTIAPGTEIYMDVDSSLEIGWNSNSATISAQGTEAQPIKICGKSADKGFWGALLIGSTVTSNSVLRNVLVDGAGRTDAALQLEAGITIDNVQVRNAGKVGAEAKDFKADSRALSVEGTSGTAVVLTGEGALTRFPLGGVLSNNTANEAALRFFYYETDTTVHNLGIPYVQESDINQNGGVLTVEAGVDYRFKPDTGLAIGWNANSAGVHINGTATAPVKFGAWQATTSQWAGLSIGSNVTTNSNITYAELSGGGSGTTPVLDIEAAVLIDHVTLRDNATGAAIAKQGLAAASKNLSITTTKARPLSVDPGALFSIPQGGDFKGNTTDLITVDGTYLEGSGTIADLGIPYVFKGAINQYGGSNITVAAGTDFVMEPDTELSVAWNGGAASFIAKGTAAAPITFTGLVASAGSWRGIVVGGAALSTTAFDYVQVGHAGGGGAGAIDIEAPSPTSKPATPITNSKFFLSAGYGVSKPRALAIDYAATNTFEMCALGNLGLL